MMKTLTQLSRGLPILASLLLTFNFTYAQLGRTIRGEVRFENGDPAPKVTVQTMDRTQAVATDERGLYEIPVAEGATLSYSLVGYQTQEVEVGTQTAINIVLLDQGSLDEVVVVGYGTQKRSDLTGAVASFNAETLEQMPQTDITQALQGRVAGLNVTFSGSNAEGGESSMLIRGRNSISASRDPFIVLDGLPYSGSLSEINPTDIESVSILKDASAAAIYGARAANGVMLITTKRGKEGEMRVSVNSHFGISNIANLPDMQDAETFFETKLLRFGRDNISVTEREGYLQGRDIDWVGLATRQGSRQEHNVVLSGGTEKMQYYLSGTYHESNGIAKNDKFVRPSLRFSLDTQLKPWLQLGTSTQLAMYNRDGLAPNFEDAFAMNPLAEPFEEDGSIKIWPWAENVLYRNPLEPLNVHNLDRTYGVITSNYAQVDFPFLEGLSYRINVGGDYRYRGVERYYGPDTRQGLEQQGRSEMQYRLRLDWTIENLLYYNRTFGDHTVGVTALYSAQERTVNDHTVNGSGFPSHTRTNFQHGAATLLTAGDTWNLTSNVSQMMRLNYGYLGKYNVTATVRRDGYSGFGEDTKYGIFPSLGLGWNIDQEQFMNEMEQINELKLRLSYGKTGNQAIGAYSTLPGLGSRHYTDINGNTAFGYFPSGIGDPTLGWETTRTLNFGLDFGILNNRIHGSIDYYRSNTTDLLLNRNISYINGTGSIRQNIGETTNNGVELQLSSTNINSADFQWTTDFNISHYRNKIVDVGLRDEQGNIIDDVANRWFIGEPIQVNFNYEFGGIFQSEEQIWNSAQPGARVGDVRVLDTNGDGIIDDQDRTIIGSRIPIFTAGLNNTFRYKDFSLSVFITAVQGISKYNYLTRTFFNGNERSYNYNFWTPENPHNDYPANRDDTNPRGVNMFGKPNDASFIRLNDVSLSYRLPATFLQPLRISKLEVFANAKNLVTLTNWVGLDPEFDDQMAIPLSRTYIFGLRLGL